MKRRSHSTIHNLIAINSEVEFCVGEDVRRDRNTKARIKRYKSKPEGNPAGLCSGHGSRVGVFICYEYLNHEVIAHEIHHAVLKVMKWANIKVSEKHGEASAHLAGNLARLFYRDLKRWKVKIKTT